MTLTRPVRRVAVRCARHWNVVRPNSAPSTTASSVATSTVGTRCRAARARPLVVDAHDGRGGPRRLEEARLRLEVVLHRAVVVQVLAAEVRERRDVEADAVDAPLVERVAGHLEGDGAGPPLVARAVGHVAQRAVQVWGRWRRALPGERADRRRGVADRREDAVQEPGDRRLAVGARDPGHREGRRGMPHDGARERGERAAQRAGLDADDDGGRADRRAGDDAHRAAPHGVVDEGLPVGRGPRQAHEHGPGRAPARVQLDRRDVEVRRVGRERSVQTGVSEQGAERRQVTSCRNETDPPASVGATTLPDVGTP